MLKRLIGCFVLLILFSFPVRAEKSPVIAKVGPYTLTRDDFQKELENNAQLKALLTLKPDMKKVLVERWVEVTLLGLAGRDAGLEKDPAVRKEIEEQTRMILARHYYEKRILQGLKVSEKEAQEYYLSHRKDYRIPERIKARHILIRIPEGGDKKAEEEALSRAREIRKKLLSGADFAELARRYSEDPGTKDRGGDLGTFSRGQMIPEFEEAVFRLKVGQISSPIRTRFGYHIVQVEAKIPAQIPPYARIKKRVIQDLLEVKKEKRLSALLMELKKKYSVEVHPENLP
ncbi:peptidylprolyl isomerase [Thermosulfurimonas sp. F29]|uniref:peptidylprolyl isomerase n=1 Tax=Thermosulfurimonas sp. F29 TaxID=2867247 RepID=UPI001C832343|nr:peptidylprolyl isomerase [Thermosulfurimonas sp. F29]MBX6424056.1 peptidylprolyl isomerase [Thermosulfurimonas sp. F29]